MKIRAMSYNVYKPNYGSCSNNGITNRYHEILVEHPEGCKLLDSDNLPENFCILDKRYLLGKWHYRFIPKHLKESGKWVMFGGCFAYASDSRFEFDYPIPIHDRVES